MRQCFGILILTVSIVSPARSEEIDVKKNAVAKVEEINQALIKGEYSKIAALTHVRVVEMTGGREKMIAEMESTMKQLKEKGIEFVAAKTDACSDPVAGGDELYVVVPFQLEMKAPGGKLRQKTFVIGVSPDKGKSWTFVNGDLDIKVVKNMLPSLPDALKLPERQMPKFEKDE